MRLISTKMAVTIAVKDYNKCGGRFATHASEKPPVLVVPDGFMHIQVDELPGFILELTLDEFIELEPIRNQAVPAAPVATTQVDAIQTQEPVIAPTPVPIQAPTQAPIPAPIHVQLPATPVTAHTPVHTAQEQVPVKHVDAPHTIIEEKKQQPSVPAVLVPKLPLAPVAPRQMSAPAKSSTAAPPTLIPKKMNLSPVKSSDDESSDESSDSSSDDSSDEESYCDSDDQPLSAISKKAPVLKKKNSEIVTVHADEYTDASGNRILVGFSEGRYYAPHSLVSNSSKRQLGHWAKRCKHLKALKHIRKLKFEYKKTPETIRCRYGMIMISHALLRMILGKTSPGPCSAEVGFLRATVDTNLVSATLEFIETKILNKASSPATPVPAVRESSAAASASPKTTPPILPPMAPEVSRKRSQIEIRDDAAPPAKKTTPPILPPMAPEVSRKRSQIEIVNEEESQVAKKAAVASSAKAPSPRPIPKKAASPIPRESGEVSRALSEAVATALASPPANSQPMQNSVARQQLSSSAPVPDVLRESPAQYQKSHRDYPMPPLERVGGQVKPAHQERTTSYRYPDTPPPRYQDTTCSASAHPRSQVPVQQSNYRPPSTHQSLQNTYDRQRYGWSSQKEHSAHSRGGNWDRR